MKRYILNITYNFIDDPKVIAFESMADAVQFIKDDTHDEAVKINIDRNYMPSIIWHSTRHAALYYHEGITSSDIGMSDKQGIDKIDYEIIEIEFSSTSIMRNERIYKALPLKDFIDNCCFIFAHAGVYLTPCVQDFHYEINTSDLKKKNEDDLKELFFNKACSFARKCTGKEFFCFAEADFYSLWYSSDIEDKSFFACYKGSTTKDDICKAMSGEHDILSAFTSEHLSDTDIECDKLVFAYSIANENEKALMDYVLVCLCGWTMHSLIEKSDSL